MPTKVIDTLILDLDNTLFDWFAVWYERVAQLGLWPQFLRECFAALRDYRAET
jgi:hypothetical protein